MPGGDHKDIAKTITAFAAVRSFLIMDFSSFAAFMMCWKSVKSLRTQNFQDFFSKHKRLMIDTNV